MNRIDRHPRRSWRRRAAGAALAALLAAVLAAVPAGCDQAEPSAVLEPYLPRTGHQAYGHSLAQARLAGTAMGRAWIEAAEAALAAPEAVELPFFASGRFEAARPAALGFAFAVDRGRRVVIDVRLETDRRAEMFVDVFERTPGGPRQVASAAPLPRAQSAGDETLPSRRIEFSTLEPGEYTLRVQPELLAGGAHTVEIRALPLLAFPVRGHDTRAILSGFGAARDGGRRSHRGVDIFAARGTDALAATDGWIARVDATSRGGNVIWLQPLFGPMRLYYAHLDTQTVEPGQFVETGEVIGTVGNTGNAVTTPPHLHFGVYVRRRGYRGGAQDPFELLR